ncbi:MAG: Formyltransferase/hydrolase complex subunit D [Gammaproteobacteria bacterium]|nr:Formyltransferase/hydrolase complex subunit D [Gammaproteobacteria bacterium]
MKINGVEIEDTYAEAFPMRATRIIVTAVNRRWALNAARAATGFATSVIACGCEAGIERELKPIGTPDGRPGVSMLLFTMSSKEMARQVQNRIGQCVLTSPTSACFAGMDPGEGERLALGKNLRFFGDGYQISKKIDGARYWRVPVMDGEFLCQENTRMVRAIGGGNFLVLAETQKQALAACEKAIAAMKKIPNVIMPFPGGVVRSGSKVGSKYKALPASTNDAYCPTLKGQVKSALPPEVGSVMEIVIDGLDEAAIRAATRAGIRAACSLGRRRGIVRISAGNYGGKLGPHLFHLRKILK